MSQDLIIRILKKHKKPMSAKEIAEKASEDVNSTSVAHNLCSLLKSRHIKALEIDRNEAMRLYHCKRRMRLYYI